MSLTQLVTGSCCHVLTRGTKHLSPTVLGHKARFPGTLWLRLPPQNPGVAFHLTCTYAQGGLQLRAQFLWPLLTSGTGCHEAADLKFS